MPQAGKSATSATVLRWRKRVGDAIIKGDLLLEIETEEGLAFIESVLDGTLKEVLAPAGKTIPVGAPLAVIGDPAAKLVQPSTPSPQPQAPSVSPTPSPAGKVIPILMPKAGQSMEEGVIVKWHVQPGATIAKGTVLFEIETDKATMEVEAADSGRMARIVVGEGGVSPVQLPVAYLADSDADVDAFIAASGTGGAPAPTAVGAAAAAAGPEPITVGVAAPAVTTDTGRVKASPAARKLAAERGVDLAAVVQGSGPGGRILSTDVPATAAVAASKPATPAAPVPQGELPSGVVRKRMSGMRKAIARNLTLSKSTIPHWYLRSKVNAGPLMSLYKSQKAKVGCSVNDVIVMACAKAIMEFPAMHSRVDGETILEFSRGRQHRHCRGNGRRTRGSGSDECRTAHIWRSWRRKTKRLANQARAGKIENMGQGIFTISNLGMYGVDDFVAIVNPPEASILAVGAVREDVIVKDGALKAGQTLRPDAERRPPPH